jgi:hypothetical protein
MSAKVHMRRVGPDEERLTIFVRALDEILRGSDKFVVYRLHPFLGQRPGVLDLLPAISIDGIRSNLQISQPVRAIARFDLPAV